MGTMGLALPWKARIRPALREPAAVGRWEMRVEPSEHLTGGPAQSGAVSEDAALAAACQAGDLRGYEQLYAMHGAKMKNLARNVMGSASFAADGAGARAREADAASTRCLLAVRSRRIPARGDCRDAGNYRSGVEKHVVSSEEEFARNTGATAKQFG